MFEFFKRRIDSRIESYLKQRATKVSPLPPRDPALVRLFGGNETTAGVDIDENAAMAYAAYFSAINLISSTFSMLEFNIWERRGLELKISNSPTNLLISRFPNDSQTANQFQQIFMYDVLARGNGYGEIKRTQSGAPLAVERHEPATIKTEIVNGHKVHQVLRKEENGTIAVARTIPDGDMLHFYGVTINGYSGISVLEFGRLTVSLGVAADTFGASFFGNGLSVNGVVSHPLELSQEAAKRLEERLNESHQGPFKAHKLLFLDEGMKFQQTTIPPDDAQFLQTRQFNVLEMCRWFRVPPHMLYDTTATTMSNAEQQHLEFMAYTMAPWGFRYNKEVEKKIVQPPNRDTYVDYTDNNIHVIDKTTRYTNYGAGRNGGWLTLNQILRAENQPLLPPDIGDTHIAPSTMRTLERADIGGNDIDFEEVQSAIEFIKNNSPVDMATATEILNGVAPVAKPEFIKAIVTLLKGKGVIK